ncbi:SIR2 family NAD-dependent protein deacylase [Bacillus cereus]|uniref:SIR2 family NAD-dependent protein deacylase n=1 Tax=Bacillus cereus TaxID=1396 RepID=UPI000B4B44D1|nr:SIR2 family protein [Bacillus cereus]
MNFDIAELNKLYQQQKIVPLIGAGLSLPFELPSWGKLIELLMKKTVNEKYYEFIQEYIDEYDYDFALKLISKRGNLSERDIQECVKQIIEEEFVEVDNDSLHNYSDLASLDFPVFLTTNYDNLLFEYLQPKKFKVHSLKDTTLSSHEITNLEKDKRIWHIHGNADETGSIVLTEKQYDELYSNEKFKTLFSLFCGQYTMLFLGFSLNDEYFKGLLDHYQKFYQGKHYVLLDNPSEAEIQELNDNYRVRVISYDSSKKGHVESIREFLREISKGTQPPSPKKKIIIPTELPSKEEKENLNDDLFHQKLLVENIDDDTRDLSQEYFLFAEKYIRELTEYDGFDEEIIGSMLNLCRMRHKEAYKKSFKDHEDSQSFVDEMHTILNEMNYGRIEGVLGENRPMEFENKGFIHVLANNPEMDIWWGYKREIG